MKYHVKASMRATEDDSYGMGRDTYLKYSFEGHGNPKQVCQTLLAEAAAQQAVQRAECAKEVEAAGRNSERLEIAAGRRKERTRVRQCTEGRGKGDRKEML